MSFLSVTDCFLFATTRGIAMTNWAYLASELMQQFSFSYRYTGNVRVAANQSLKY